MSKRNDQLFHIFVVILTVLTVGLLLFLLGFMLHESLPALREVGLLPMLTGEEWRPLFYQDAPSYGLRNILLSTLYVSLLAVAITLVIGVGCSLWLSCAVSDRGRAYLLPCIDLLAGIPSVVYGFVGLYVVVRIIERCGRPAGESILAGAIVLSVMILPYMIASCCHTMVSVYHRFAASSAALGVDRWYMAGQLVLPAARRGILISTALSTGRAMGETMAVMMVLGNAITRPTLLGKGETISALIALEMGTAERGSIHFSALYAAGLILLVLLLAIQLLFSLLQRKLWKEERL